MPFGALEADAVDCATVGTFRDGEGSAVRRAEQNHYPWDRGESWRNVFEWSPIGLWEQDFSKVEAWMGTLRDREVRDLRSYLDSNPDELDRAIALVEVVEANPAGLRLIGAVGKDQLFSPEILTEEVRDSFIVPFLAIWHGQDRYELQVAGSTVSGERIDVVLHWAAPLVDGRPDYSRVVIAIVDVTTARRAEQARRDAEELFLTIFEYAPTATGLVTLDGPFAGANPALCRLVGYSESELLSMSWADITHPDDLEESRASMRPVLAGEFESCELEKRYLRSDGEVIWARFSTSLVRDRLGDPSYLIGQFADITELKESATSLDR